MLLLTWNNWESAPLFPPRNMLFIWANCRPDHKKIIFFFHTGHEPNTDVGPLITPAAKERCERLIQSGIDQGANVTTLTLFVLLTLILSNSKDFVLPWLEGPLILFI